jgi:hypothetical protein
MPEWTEEKATPDLRVWRDAQGAVLSLAVPAESIDLPPHSDEAALRRWCRRLAESRRGGLVEVTKVTGPLGTGTVLIYKRLEKPAYIYTGMLILPTEAVLLFWTVVAGERGTTGVREAVVTAELMNAGRLTIRDYEHSWAQDPYDTSYHGVDRSVLRFISDDESYDDRFPDHPLSKVRQVLAALAANIQLDPEAPQG